jgi:hypothetical protein
MASRSKMRHTVAAEMASTTARMTSSRASPAQLQRDSGTPVFVGGERRLYGVGAVLTSSGTRSTSSRTGCSGP